ncbi:MAG: hypothetical protein QNJ70_01630 [Xenococcaceae cyanobacterium MO_207.B15]|nr:hypothetical protein [Xenococcaceae cyanobacterium MO_207.B15]
MILKRPKITLAVPFAVFPPNNVRCRRIFHIYRHLAKDFNIEIVSLADAGEAAFQGIIAPGLTETRVPKSPKHQKAEMKLVQKLGANIADATLMQLYTLSPKYLQALKKSAKSANFVLTYQPYLFPAIREVCNKPVWYEVSGIETELKKQLLPENELGQEFWESVYEVEAKCAKVSNLIITSSQHDAQSIAQFQDVESSKVIYLPNGIDTERIEFTSYEQRLVNKEKLGLKDGFLAVFTGTGSPHNADEARSILNIASKLQNMNFLLLGDVGVFFEPRLTPPNVTFLPSADENTKSIILSLADVALNPVKKGSDSQSIVLEYFCKGIPVVSTRFGVKSLGIKPEKHCLIGDVWQFPELIVSCEKEDIVTKKMRLQTVKRYIKNNLEWSVISHKILDKFQFHLLIA